MVELSSRAIENLRGVEYHSSSLDEIHSMKLMPPQYRLTDNPYSSFPTEDGCPYNLGMSLIDESPLATNGQRRPSFDSVESSVPPELFSASSVGTMSPSTPVNSSLFSSNYPDIFRNANLQVNLQSMWSQQQEDFGEHNFGYSPASTKENNLPRYINPCSMSTNSSEPFYSFNGFSSDGISPALSRPIFDHTTQSTTPLTSSTTWALASIAKTPPRTIDPSAFAQLFPNTPTLKTEGPSTPSRSNTRSSLILSSSPISGYSPRIVPSQREVDDSPYFDLSALSQDPSDLAYEGMSMSIDMRDHGRFQSRLTRRKYDRKGVGSGSKRRPLANKSGFECDRVIPANSFACSYPDCKDKATGVQKRFKRAEHKKRHEKTVHQKESHVSHRCWVAQCEKSFSRTDNLKSHLLKTHGKRSPGARNRYVATLDSNNSQYFSPDWRGELTQEGLPIRTRAGPAKV